MLPYQLGAFITLIDILHFQDQNPEGGDSNPANAVQNWMLICQQKAKFVRHC